MLYFSDTLRTSGGRIGTVSENDEIEQKVRLNYGRIVCSIEPRGFIVNYLYSKKVLTMSQMEKICECKDSNVRAEKLLNILLKTKMPNSLVVFSESLYKKDEYGWIAKMIRPKVDSKSTNSSTMSANSNQNRNRTNMCKAKTKGTAIKSSKGRGSRTSNTPDVKRKTEKEKIRVGSSF